jgi:hypothetical protein
MALTRLLRFDAVASVREFRDLHDVDGRRRVLPHVGADLPVGWYRRLAFVILRVGLQARERGARRTRLDLVLRLDLREDVVERLLSASEWLDALLRRAHRND